MDSDSKGKAGAPLGQRAAEVAASTAVSAAQRVVRPVRGLVSRAAEKIGLTPAAQGDLHTDAAATSPAVGAGDDTALPVSSPTRKPSAKRTAVKKAPAKKSPGKKTPAKEAASKKVPGKTTAPKQAAAATPAAKKAPGKASLARKADKKPSVEISSAGGAAVKKSPVKRTAQKAPVKAPSAKKADKTPPVRISSAGGAAVKKSPVKRAAQKAPVKVSSAKKAAAKARGHAHIGLDPVEWRS